MKAPLFRSCLPTIFGVLALSACGSDPEPPSTTMPPPADGPIDAPKLASRKLGTRGTALVDALGRRVILRGVNVGGRSKMPPFMPFDVASDTDNPAAMPDLLMTAVKNLGANGIRLLLSWEALEPSRGTFQEAYIRNYRSLLDAADRAGLSVIIDFHQDVFQAAFCGDGFPEWALGDIPHGPPHYDCGALAWSLPYFDRMSDVNRAFDRVWDNQDGLLDAFVGMWTRVAREFGQHPAVAAFEVMNEPGSGSRSPEAAGATILPLVYDRVARAIEAEAGPSVVLGDDPIALANDAARLSRPEHERFAYGPHFYDPLTTIGLPVDQARIRAEVAAIIDRGDMYASPVVVGEFGAPNTIMQKPEFLTAVLDVADSRSVSAMAWEASISSISWNSEDFSVLTDSGAERPWGAVIDRPVARAVDGTIIDLQWDSAAKKFTLSVEGQGDNVSEIYLPVRHLGMAPKIAVTGARHRWVPETATVLVAPARGVSWSLVAEPETTVAP